MPRGRAAAHGPAGESYSHFRKEKTGPLKKQLDLTVPEQRNLPTESFHLWNVYGARGSK